MVIQHFPQKPVPVLYSFYTEEIFPNVQPKPLLKAISSSYCLSYFLFSLIPSETTQKILNLPRSSISVLKQKWPLKLFPYISIFSFLLPFF